MSRGIRIAALAAGLAPAVGLAHGLDPASLALRETRAGVFEVRWRASALRLPGANVQPVLPARCHQVGPAVAVDEADRITLRWTVECGPGGLAGDVIGVDDLAAAKINALLTVERLDGEKLQTVLGPGSPSFTVPARPSRWEVVRGYLTLGMEHILTGPDHLLFVFALVLLAGTARRVVATVTAFTFGHSITLTLAALGLIVVPSRPIEVAIATTVLAVAVELARPRAASSLARRRPWLMAATFGLLHGLGFAAALREAGLPAGEVPLALLSFNVGIEAGQVGFVLGVLALRRAVHGFAADVPGWLRQIPVYGMGTLAGYWWLDRLLALIR